MLNLCPAIEVFIISDKKMGYQSQETVDRYRAYARGFTYQGDIRHVLTTRRERRKREKLFEALLHQLEALAREKPVLMIFEDVTGWTRPRASCLT